jgi:hypothetical protein
MLVPIYDLLSTRSDITEDSKEMVLYLNDKKNSITRKKFDKLTKKVFAGFKRNHPEECITMP